MITSETRGTEELEWIIADGTGTFAMGCLAQTPRRKYHSFLSVADGLISSGGLKGGKNLVLDLREEIHSDHIGVTLLGPPQKFLTSPKLTWFWRTPIGDLGTLLVQRRFEALKHCCRADMESGFRLGYSFAFSKNNPAKSGSNKLNFTINVLPRLLSRPIHDLTEKNPVLNGMAHRTNESTWEFKLYPNDPRIIFSWSGAAVDFVPDGKWEPVEHPWESLRGYPSREECFVPGSFALRWDGSSEFKFSVQLGYKVERAGGEVHVPSGNKPQSSCNLGCDCNQEYPEYYPEYKEEVGNAVETSEAKNSSLMSRISRVLPVLRSAARTFAADLFEDKGSSPTLLAGLPWFGPWARDLFVCMPGYSLALGQSELPYLMMTTGGLRLLKDISGESPSTSMNAHGADTPWLYLWAIEQLVHQGTIPAVQERVLLELGADIAQAVMRGAQQGVRVEAQGGIRVENGPWAKTWMDALIDGKPVTPRHGFPIEINALMISGLGFLLERMKAHRALGQIKESYEASRRRFAQLFVSSGASGANRLGDVFFDGGLDTSVRPNSLWALALPRVPMEKDVALTTLNIVRSQLLTPMGLRTLSPSDRSYRGQCVGDQKNRDTAYHQGTVWPWLLGIYADAVLRWEGREALAADLNPVWKRLEHHLSAEGCIGQVSEIFDGDAPHEPRGAPAQAWSACELLRVATQMPGLRS